MKKPLRKYKYLQMTVIYAKYKAENLILTFSTSEESTKFLPKTSLKCKIVSLIRNSEDPLIKTNIK